jgi:hypothetical protein
LKVLILFYQAVATAKVHFWRESQEWTIKNAKSILLSRMPRTFYHQECQEHSPRLLPQPRSTSGANRRSGLSRMPRAFYYQECQEHSTIKNAKSILPGCCHSQGPLLARIAGVDYQECQEHSTRLLPQPRSTPSANCRSGQPRTRSALYRATIYY